MFCKTENIHLNHFLSDKVDASLRKGLKVKSKHDPVAVVTWSQYAKKQQSACYIHGKGQTVWNKHILINY